jgi:multidrug resistance efflux pump
LEEASLQLDYTQVKSPINGLVDRNLVDLGTLVGAQDKTLLTTVVNDESVYVYFNISL